MYRQSLLGPVDPSFRALSERLKFTIRRHQSNKDLLYAAGGARGQVGRGRDLRARLLL